VKKLVKDEGTCSANAGQFIPPLFQSAGNLEGMDEEIRYEL
jgi:hypothetical protein